MFQIKVFSEWGRWQSVLLLQTLLYGEQCGMTISNLFKQVNQNLLDIRNTQQKWNYKTFFLKTFSQNWKNPCKNIKVVRIVSSCLWWKAQKPWRSLRHHEVVKLCIRIFKASLKDFVLNAETTLLKGLKVIYHE